MSRSACALSISARPRRRMWIACRSCCTGCTRSSRCISGRRSSSTSRSSSGLPCRYSTDDYVTHPSASFSATLRVHLDDRPGAFADLARAIGDAGGLLGAIDLVRVEPGKKVRDVTVMAGDADHTDTIVAAARAVHGVEVEHVSDRTFLMHLGGKIEVNAKTPLKTRDDLSMAYTPGVARVCMAFADDPELVWNLTVKRNTVAVVTDGTAVLGLGDIGPEAALPVMEGKALLFKEFGGIDAWPICLATTDEDEIVAAVRAIAPVFGGINLEDISAPRCFRIEERLRDELDIPVFHDDQHGTAVVVLAAFLNALRVVGKRPEQVKVVITGAGAAGAVSVKGIRAMADGAVVFAMANTIPEILPQEIEGVAAVIATGRSDYPNQINNVLAFPGIFRGALDARASDITEAMKVAAAEAIAGAIPPDELSPDYIVPSVFNREVAALVAAAVAEAATPALV